ncbi:hypothetical protein AB0K16_33750 [Nonomuraea jabiensis]|uniref:hypothetical protein n=1 Tax=Nonomuraea jabiensis TaxID=882448 RepID=UPI00343A3250
MMRSVRSGAHEKVSGEPAAFLDAPHEQRRVVARAQGTRCAVAVGFSGGGFRYAPAVGEALAGLLVGGVTEAGIRRFAPGRSATV